MSTLLFTAIVGSGSLIAGLVGALTGLGGGVVIVPMLVIVFGVDLRYAIGASLVSVIATSSGSAASYLEEGYSNVRIAMLLEVATTTGALIGAFLVAARVIPHSIVAIVFGVVLLVSALVSSRPRPEVSDDVRVDPLADRLRLHGTHPTAEGMRSYRVQGVIPGFVLMLVAGILSGLLGIGSGALKVLAMDHAMRIPFKVSTTTSNFMIGVTAAASAGVYVGKGYVDPGLAMPVMLGVMTGSFIGARLLHAIETRWLRRIFAVVILVLAAQMIYRGVGGQL